jgi:hypothetical protein
MLVGLVCAELAALAWRIFCGITVIGEGYALLGNFFWVMIGRKLRQGNHPDAIREVFAVNIYDMSVRGYIAYISVSLSV